MKKREQELEREGIKMSIGGDGLWLCYACWANNHNGWAKMKKFNKRKAKRKIRNENKMKLKNEEDI